MTKTNRLLSFVLVLCLCFSVFTPCVIADEPTEYATREYIISEFVQSVGRANLEKSSAVLDFFADSEKISAEYKEDVSRAIVGGILKGYDDRTIRPGEPVKRVEAMVMLARCIPALETTNDAIEFTDVPEWAKKDIEYLSKAGIVKGYGDGTMGADDFITEEQVALLVQRNDDLLRTVMPSDSFYGYVNEKIFRNITLEDAAIIDPIHGAIIAGADEWSYFTEVSEQIVEEEKEILEKIVNGEVEIEKGTPEQRVLDMLECINSNVVFDEDDKKNINDMRKAILDAENVEEFLNVVSDIYKLAGINVAFDINIDIDKKTGVPYPAFSIATTGSAGYLDFRTKTSTDDYKEVYAELVADYLESIGADFEEQDIMNALELQVASTQDEDYYATIVAYLAYANIFELITQEEMYEEIVDMMERNPLFFDAETETNIGTKQAYVSKVTDDADAAYTGFDLCSELSDYGFTNLEKIIVPVDEISEVEKYIICEENLDALKINALIKLSENLSAYLSAEEELANEILKLFPVYVALTTSAEELKEELDGFKAEREDDEDAENGEEIFAETTGIEYDEGLLSAVNLTQLNSLLPDDIGFIYTKYYYDDAISDTIVRMVMDIGDAYLKRFQENTWMSEETKVNAIKKLENMLAVIAYPDNYTFPEITPMSEGGTLFSNTLSIKRHDLADKIRANEEKIFVRTTMFCPPDMVNAFYLPEFNIINIPAGILNPPFYDPEASYAANLGSIGMVIAHEIGHAFDKNGAMYDENGYLNNWWTEEDYNTFLELQNHFVDYYNQFEVVDGVIQDATITITENMADFAGMQIIMDVIGDDKQAQKECFEAYAHMWAHLATVSYLTHPSLLTNVHAADVVRVNAIVASFEQFYEIYGIEEGDAMYVAPEDRLKLW